MKVLSQIVVTYNKFPVRTTEIFFDCYFQILPEYIHYIVRIFSKTNTHQIELCKSAIYECLIEKLYGMLFKSQTE